MDWSRKFTVIAYSIVLLGLLVVSFIVSLFYQSFDDPFVTLQNSGSVSSNEYFQIKGVLSTSETFPNKLALDLTAVSIGRGLLQVGEKACIRNVVIETNSARSSYLEGIDLKDIEGVQWAGYKFPPTSGELLAPYCFNNLGGETTAVTLFIDHSIDLILPADYAYVFYPFDRIVLLANVAFEWERTLVDGTVIEGYEAPVSQEIEVRTNGWVVQQIEGYSSRFPADSDDWGIIIQRNMGDRLVLPFLLFLFLVSTVFIAFTDTASEAISLTLALFVAFWGIRQVLVPSSAPGLLFIDLSIAAGYLVALIAVAHKLWVHRETDDHANSS